MQPDSLLIRKYNTPTPRYTSYPTVPFWDETINKGQWTDEFRRQLAADTAGEGISLYLHLPFCESLCTYCGCNKKITTNHGVEEQYLRAIAAEWSLYRALMEQPPVIREIHLGGGTPTFFSPHNLEKLMGILLDGAIVHQQHAFSLEGHPNNTTLQHLRSLAAWGFNRISYGVQDNNPDVQQIINRIQPFENVERATDMARQAGFLSVNFDLIYGLPLQDRDKLSRTVTECISLHPDRVAFYSYAHVPWTSRGQRLFDERHLPSADEKLALYVAGRQLFLDSGYADIGMDHFSLPTDDLYIARENGTLHRNFMGYSTQKSRLLLGLGVSSISDTGTAFAQNDKTLARYYEAVHAGTLPVTKGYFLSEEDKAFRRHILDIICRGTTRLTDEYLPETDKWVLPVLRELQNDGLVLVHNREVEVTETGRYFLRNISSAFDLKLQRSRAQQVKEKLFSNAI